MNTGVIIAMAVLTVGSAVTEKVLTGIGKTDEAMQVSFATKSGIAITALTIFAKFIKVLGSL